MVVGVDGSVIPCSPSGRELTHSTVSHLLVLGMPTDKHYNAPNDLPDALQDKEPTDMPATIGIFITIAIVAAISLAALALFQYIW